MSNSPAPRPTMKEVARLAGVSIKTVSRVINGEQHVSAAVTERVNKAAAQLDYRPDFTARSLRQSSRATKTVGLILDSVDNPFSAGLLRAVEDAATAEGSAVLATSVDEDPDRARRLVRTLLSRQVDGLIIAAASGDQSYLAREIAAGTPVVFIDRPPENLTADTVMADNVGGAYAGVDQLLAVGHHDIAFLGDHLTIRTAAERLEGFRSALADHGATVPEEHVVVGLHSPEAAESAVRSLLLSRQPPTALFTAQNLITIGAIRALRDLGLQDRVALIGFDDVPLSDLLDPPVAVVEQRVYEIGRTAAQLLFQRLAGIRSEPGELLRIPTDMRLRATGTIPPPPA